MSDRSPVPDDVADDDSTASPDRAGPLAGIRVLDFSRVLSGPIVGRMLADLGADVVKIESPEGDLTRFATPRVHSLSLYFTQQNVGKRNVSVDLHRPEGADLVRRLGDSADVVLENFRPGVMGRFGLGYDDLAARNPGLVYASISGYGQTGPWAARRAYAVVVHAETGLLEAGARWRSDAAGRPQPMAQDPMSHADVYAGLSCCSAILAALLERTRSGRGQHLDVAMADAMLFVNDFAHWGYSPVDPGDARPALAPPYSPVVATGAGRDLVIAGDPAAPVVFELYCRAMDRPALAADPRFADEAARRAHRADLLEEVAEWAGGWSDLDGLRARLAEAGLATGEVRSVAEVVETDWADERGVLVAVDDRAGGTVPVVESPFRFSRSDVGAHGTAAYRGEHNHSVLAERLGLEASEVDRLEAAGILSHRRPDEPGGRSARR